MRTNNTPATMNANEINALELLEMLPAAAVRAAAAAILPAKYFDEYFTPETANVEYLRSMLENAIREHDINAAQLNEATRRRFGCLKGETATETPPAEFSGLSHAAQCLSIYLHNTREIYDRYTVPAIKDNATAFRHRNGAKYTAAEYWEVLERTAKDLHNVKKALRAAARLVHKYDHVTPTAQDIEQVARNYAAYTVECAKYEIENA